MIYQIETDDGVLHVIRHPLISENVEFKLDKPHVIGHRELFELRNGQWYKFNWEHGERVEHLLEGRWKLHG